MTRKNSTTPTKVMAYKFAKTFFGLEAADISDRSGDLSGIFYVNRPLFIPTSPHLLSIPLELVIYQRDGFQRFSILSPKPYFVDTTKERLSKVFTFTRAFMTYEERLHVVGVKDNDNDAGKSIGLIYFYSGKRTLKSMLECKVAKADMFKDIEYDLTIIFAMLISQLDISINDLIHNNMVRCSSLIIDE